MRHILGIVLAYGGIIDENFVHVDRFESYSRIVLGRIPNYAESTLVNDDIYSSIRY